MSTTATLTITITELTFADSLTPMTIRIVTATVMRTAGRLKIAVGAAAGGRVINVQGAAGERRREVDADEIVQETRAGGRDQPTATVAAPSAYSRIRSQPMIQAKNSPSVA